MTPNREMFQPRKWHWLLTAFILAPVQLGAKGCETGVVGSDGTGGSAGTSTTTAIGGGSGIGGSSGATGTGGAPTQGKTCGGFSAATCGAGEYCKYAVGDFCGAADAPGVCTPKPQVCADIYQPVCGCDDVTYGNECEAAAKGVAIRDNKACGGDPAVSCGGITGLACDVGEFCSFPPEAQCGAADRLGTCQPVPQGCYKIYAPVCGCDDKTYGNDCMAAAASVSIAYTGECKTEPNPGAACGGIAGLACAKGEYCNYAKEAMCGAADQTGTCAPIPEACDMMYAPVCGCDDKTYGNACSAAAAGVSVASTGVCGGGTTGGTVCGGLAGLACAKDEFCNYPITARCGAADQTGVCSTTPDACTMEYSPVCGCDGKTYGNACAAASAGVSVAATGECAR